MPEGIIKVGTELEVAAASVVTVEAVTAIVAVIMAQEEAVMEVKVMLFYNRNDFYQYSDLGGRDRGDYGGKRDLDRRDNYG